MNTNRILRKLALSACVAIAPSLSSFVSPAKAAGLALTPAGITAGFSLTTFATGFPTDADEANGTAGPLGMAFVGSGVFVGDAPGNVRLFPTDVDGQTIAAAPAIDNFGHNNALGLAQVGSNYFMTQQDTNEVVQIVPATASITKVVTSITNATGIVTNPLTGHLLVSTYQDNNIYDVDPVTGTTTLFTNAFLDGLTTDGTTLYGADPGTSHVLGFNLATKAQVFDSGAITGVPDGTALGSGIFAGNLFANTNGGTLVEINLKTQAQTIIATGGSRGDFVQIDPNNDTLLITQSDSIDRLTAPNGGGFGNGGGAVPLPSAAWIGIEFLAGVMMFKAISIARARIT